MTTLHLDDAIGDQAVMNLEITCAIVEEEMKKIKEQVSDILHYRELWKGASAVEFYEEFGKTGNAFNEQLAQMKVLHLRLLREVTQWKTYGHKLT